jgi:DNA-binding transcriptional MerR regulator
MADSDKIYFSIGEVAEIFNVNTSLIRFWEKEFEVLRPKKSKKGNRLFTQQDMRYLHMIFHLVKEKGYTLNGAREALKNNFDQHEAKVHALQTLQKVRKFLIDLDEGFEEKLNQIQK